VEFTILGRTQLHVAGQPVYLGVAKQRALLTILLLNVGRPVLVDTIVQQLWNGRSSDEIKGTLHSPVSRLRGILKRAGVPNDLRNDAGSYRLDLDPRLVDYHRFRQQVDRANTARSQQDHLRARSLLSDAVALWHGVPLTDLRTEWAAERRGQMIIGDLVPAQHSLISSLLELNEHAEALRLLGPMIDDHPTDEVFAMQRMLALDRMGRFVDATSFFVRFRRQVLNELGAEPGPAIQAAHAEILSRHRSGTPAPTNRNGTPVSHLPRGATNFTGRETLVTALDDHFINNADAHHAKVVALHGMPGVGKTSLAVFWATSRRHRFPGGQFFLNLNAYGAGAPVSAADAMTALLGKLGVAADRIPADVDQRQAKLSAVLGARSPTLLVLDNVGDSDHSRPLLNAAGTTCSVLLTSRGRLTGLAVIDGVDTVEVAPMSHEESTILLRRQIGRPRCDREPAALDVLAGLSGGLPLALKIIGHRVATRADAGLAELAYELDGLLVSMTDSDDQAATLAGVFSWSYGGLSDGAARLFRLLGLHPGRSLSSAAADALSGGAHGATQDHLDELTQCHLLEPIGRHRYQLHDLLHEYAADLTEAEEPEDRRRTALVQLADFYLDTATNVRRQLIPQAQDVPRLPTNRNVVPTRFTGNEDAHRWLDQERNNLIAVTHRAARHGLHGHAWRIPATVSEGFERSGFKDDFLDALAVGLQSAKLLGDRPAEAGMLINIGRIHFGRRDYLIALEYFRLAVTTAIAAGNVELRAIGQHNLATAHLELGELGVVVQLYEETVQVFRESGSAYGQAYGLHRIADTYRRLGDYDKALAYFESTLRIRREIDHLRGQGDTLTDLGSLYLEWGRYDDARDHCLRALEIHELSHDDVKAAEALTVLASVEYTIGSLVEAARHAARAIELGESTQDSLRQARALAVLGRVRRTTGDRDGARTAWTRAVSIFDDLTSTEGDAVRSQLSVLDTSTDRE